MQEADQLMCGPMKKMYGHTNLIWVRTMVFLTLLVVCSQFSTTAQPFVRVNSGTKSDIKHISMLKGNQGFFLADNIYSLKQGVEWAKTNFPSIRTIVLFSANSVNDFWYTTSLENSTSIIYHYHDNLVECIVGPFGVSIYSMYVTPDNVALFTSFSEVAVYQNGQFKKIELAPTRSYIKKIVARSGQLFWILTCLNELFVYNGTKYQRILEDKNVADFAIVDEKLGYALCDNEIVEFNGLLSKPFMVNNEFRKVEKIFVSKKDDIWLIGAQSKILRNINSHLYDLSLKEKFYLTDLSIVGADEVWIAGNDGVLLYHGNKAFPSFEKSNPGFSSFRLTNFGIDLDNEYGVALADFNGDGKIDIFSVCIFDVNRLFINEMKSESDTVKGNFFREEGFIRKSEGILDSKSESNQAELKLGVSVADVDNDGDEDVYICYLNSRNKLLLNNGKGVFRDVSYQRDRACENFDRCTAATFADVDLDGNIDLYVTSENGSNKLFHNDGTGHFTDITASSGLVTVYGGSCASFSDVNSDGYPDLCATFWYVQNRIYLNESQNGVVKFREATEQTDLAKSSPAKSNGVTFADINNDGFPDLFIANKNEENKLYLNNGQGSFRDVTESYFPKNKYLSNGAVIADFDQDGYQDLYLTNVGENILYKNIRGLYFKNVTADFGAELTGYSTGSAVGDLDNDGNTDLYSANYIGGSSKVFMNQSRHKSTLKFKLEGTLSNRDAIGTKIYLYAKNQDSGKITLEGFQEISGGGGYASISAKEAIFPLIIDKQYFAVVKFPYPGSEMKIEDLKPGILWVREQIGLSAFYSHFKKFILRAVKDPEILKEYLKAGILLLIFLFYFKSLVYGEDRINRIRKSAVFALFVFYLFLNLLFIDTSSVVSFLTPIFIVLVLLIIMHLITERMQVSQNLLKQRMKLREKISRDLHDDLASTLGSISIYSDTLKRMEDPVQSEVKKLSLKIAELTQTALHSITDIIWMTSPRNDSLQGLLAKINNLLYETLTDNGIQYHAEINTPDQSIVLPDELKNDIFLILKEATNNIIRHAKAKNVKLIADTNELTCSISIMDDGLGFDEKNLRQQISHGNGLINIRRRALESKIDLSVDSYEGKGTVISLIFKI